MGTLYRAQILLEPEQHQTLAEIAKNDGRSISDVVREIIREYLAEQSRDEQLERELAALESLAQMRQKIQARHGIINRDLVTEIRSEREADLEQAWGNQT